MLGEMYLHGKGGKANQLVAVTLLNKASDNGHSLSQFSLGTMYSLGNGVRKDHHKALEFYTKAANHDHNIAQFILGVFYYNGENVVRQDYDKAHAWFLKAANAGHAPSQKKLAEMYFNGIGGVPQDFDKAYYFYKRAAIYNDAESKFKLGYMYENGRGADKDTKQSIEWYIAAGKLGHKIAPVKLYDYYMSKKNYIEAYAWYDTASRELLRKHSNSFLESSQGILSKLAEKKHSEAKRMARKYQGAIRMNRLFKETHYAEFFYSGMEKL